MKEWFLGFLEEFVLMFLAIFCAILLAGKVAHGAPEYRLLEGDSWLAFVAKRYEYLAINTRAAEEHGWPGKLIMRFGDNPGDERVYLWNFETHEMSPLDTLDNTPDACNNAALVP